MLSSSLIDVAIVGAGHAGSQTAIALRQLGFRGSIGIFDAEPDHPYERPPLSKEYLTNEKEFTRMLIRPEAFWAQREIELRLGALVTSVDAARKTITVNDQTEVSFGKLVWAAGGETRRLNCAGSNLPGVHTLRSRSDADQLKAELPDAQVIVVIGAGYIGLEAASALTKLGKHVVVLEAQDRVLARVTGPPLSTFLEKEHRSHGVDLRLNTVVNCIEGDNGVTGVQLASGQVIDCDMVVVGIGISPAVDVLGTAGARIANGVVVDEACRTSLPEVYAIGDCAQHFNRHAGQMVRLESVQNATDQAMIAAKSIVGEEAFYDALPWFWSNQFELKLQTVGLFNGHDQMVTRGDPASKSFSVVYLRGGKVIALDCVNATRDYVQGRKLILSGTQVSAEAVARPDQKLADLILAP